MQNSAGRKQAEGCVNMTSVLSPVLWLVGEGWHSCGKQQLAPWLVCQWLESSATHQNSMFSILCKLFEICITFLTKWHFVESIPTILFLNK